MQTTADSALSPATLKAIEETLRAFARAFRAYQLYLPNNPMRTNGVEAARLAFRELWREVPTVSVSITDTALLAEGHVVLHDDERGTSGLPWLLHRDGLRRLDISEGFEDEELATFIELLHRARSGSADEDDLVTMLWLADFAHVQYRHTDILTEPEVLNAQGEADAAADRTTPTGDQLLEATLVDGPAPAFVDLGDYDSTLHFLDTKEAAYLHEELRREYETDGSLEVMAALFDIIEAQGELESQLEACDVVDQLVVEGLAAGNYAAVAYVLREARATLTRRTDLDEAVRAALISLPARLSEPAVITQLLHALGSGEQSPLLPLLESFISELRPAALVPLLAWYADAPAAQASPSHHVMEQAVRRLASRNVTELVRLLDHENPAVVRGAVLMAREVASPALVPPLTRLLADSAPDVRTGIVVALAAIASPRAMQVLEQAVDDDQRDVRIAALKAIAAGRYMPAMSRLQSGLQRKQLRNADLSEKMAYLEAFGAICGDTGVPALSALLNARGLMGFRESPEMRACAAHALGLVGSVEAQRALGLAADSVDVVVRSAVARALRSGS